MVSKTGESGSFLPNEESGEIDEKGNYCFTPFTYIIMMFPFLSYRVTFQTR